MKECEICKKVSYEHQFDRTTDGKDVCLGCMSQAQDHYKKGLLNSKEIKDYYDFLKNYKKKLQEVVLLAKKHGILRNEDPVKILKEVKELENKLSKTAYNKAPSFQKATVKKLTELKGEVPLTIKEHYLIVTKILDNFDLIRPNAELPKIKENNNGRYYRWGVKNYISRYIV